VGRNETTNFVVSGSKFIFFLQRGSSGVDILLTYPSGPSRPLAGQKNEIDIEDVEASRGLSSPKCRDMSRRLRLSTFQHHLQLLLTLSGGIEVG